MKINKMFIFMIICLLIISTVSCGRSIVEITEEYMLKKNGVNNDITVGTIAVVELEENASTGYEWKYFIDNEDLLSFDSDTIKAENNNPAIVGAPTKHEWKFKALKKGSISLKFAYLREWEVKDIESLENSNSIWEKISETAVKNIEYIINIK